MRAERFGVFAPFLLVDAVLGFVLVWLLQLDWIVHNVLYSYGLVFSVDWAVPYWMAFRACFVLGLFGIGVVTVVGVVSVRRVIVGSERTVFLCKHCGRAWVELDRHVQVGGGLPRFRVVLSCPLCDMGLLDLEGVVVEGGGRMEAEEDIKC